MVHGKPVIGDEPVVLVYAGLFATGEPLTSRVDERGTSTS